MKISPISKDENLLTDEDWQLIILFKQIPEDDIRQDIINLLRALNE